MLDIKSSYKSFNKGVDILRLKKSQVQNYITLVRIGYIMNNYTSHVGEGMLHL